MELKDFIDFDSLIQGSVETIIKVEKSPNHQTYDCKKLKDQPDKSEIFQLINRAKDSFLSFKKLKNTFIEEKYIYDNFGMKLVHGNFYLSNDNKFYCAYMYIGSVFYTINLIGIFEKTTGKYFTFVYICKGVVGYTFITNNEYTIKNIPGTRIENISDPLDIIVGLEDVFSGLNSVNLDSDSDDYPDSDTDSNYDSDADRNSDDNFDDNSD